MKNAINGRKVSRRVSLLRCLTEYHAYVCAQVLCIIPTSFPVTLGNMNWTIVIVGIVLALCMLTWFFPLGGARWHTGKAHRAGDGGSEVRS